jgi:hypothetical protein
VAEEFVSLGELADDLVGRMPSSLPRVLSSFPMIGLGLAHRVDNLKGTRSPGLASVAPIHSVRCDLLVLGVHSPEASADTSVSAKAWIMDRTRS